MNIFPLLLGFIFGAVSSYKDIKTLRWEVWKTQIATAVILAYWAVKGDIYPALVSYFLGLALGVIGWAAGGWDHEDAAAIAFYSALVPEVHGLPSAFVLTALIVVLFVPIATFQLAGYLKKGPALVPIFEAWILTALATVGVVVWQG